VVHCSNGLKSSSNVCIVHTAAATLVADLCWLHNIKLGWNSPQNTHSSATAITAEWQNTLLSYRIHRRVALCSATGHTVEHPTVPQDTQQSHRTHCISAGNTAEPQDTLQSRRKHCKATGHIAEPQYALQSHRTHCRAAGHTAEPQDMLQSRRTCCRAAGHTAEPQDMLQSRRTCCRAAGHAAELQDILQSRRTHCRAAWHIAEPQDTLQSHRIYIHCRSTGHFIKGKVRGPNVWIETRQVISKL
jgi:hypothetical protein